MVDDDRIGPQGRKVRCASCGGSWRAMPEGAAGAPEPASFASVAEPATLEIPAAEDAAVRAPSLPQKIRAKAKAEERTRKAVGAGVVWGALGAMVLAIVGGAALFRVDIVRVWPRTAGAYAKVGLSVNPTGLAPEGVQASAGLKNGHAAVIVSGMIRNIETAPQEPVPVRVSLLDKSGKKLVNEVVALAPGKLAPGQTRPFTVAFLDPPSAGVNVEVSFVLDAPKPKADHGHGAKDHAPKAQAPDAHGGGHEQAAADGHAPVLRGRADAELPMQAVPTAAHSLPADSPYALPAATQAQGQPHINPHDG